MPENNKNEKERIYKELLNSDDESTQANLEIQDEFYSEKETTDPASSPVPYVTNNTAPLFTGDDKNKKR